MDVLVIKGLKKRFGSQQVIDKLELTVPEGSVYGFIGQNGAGKTTTMKMVLGLLEADEGEIFVCNETVHFGRTKTNQYIGYLPDVPEFYNYMNPPRYLALCGEVIGLTRQETESRSRELLKLVGLDGVEKRIGGFSRGMKQRLGIAQALLTRPRLLICDEPTSALDPVGRKEILDILCRIKGTTTVLFSTHILSDVERICDYAAVLHNGRAVVNGTLSGIKAMHGHDSLLLEFADAEDMKRLQSYQPAAPLLAGAKVKEKELILQGRDLKTVQSSLIKALAETGICPLKMEFAEPSLEALFLEVIS